MDDEARAGWRGRRPLLSSARGSCAGDELLTLERALAERDWTVTALDQLIDAGFVEVGRSGRIWDRIAVLELLASAPDCEVRIADFTVTMLGDDVALATYTTMPYPAWRSSLWIRRDGRGGSAFTRRRPNPMRASDLHSARLGPRAVALTATGPPPTLGAH